MSQTLAQRLAAYSTGLTFDKLTREAVHETKRRLIDSFATAVGAMPGDAYPIARSLRAVAPDRAGFFAAAAVCLGPNGVLLVEVRAGDDTRLLELRPHETTALPRAA